MQLAALLLLISSLSSAEGASLTLPEALGRVANQHRHFSDVFAAPGQPPKITNGTADENGFRQSPSSGRKGKRKHLLLIGGTSIFGRGLKDDETVSHLINQRSRDYEAYPLAYFGFGLQHAWIRFTDGNLPKQVRFRGGRAILLADENSILKLFGAVEVLSHKRNLPVLRILRRRRKLVATSLALLLPPAPSLPGLDDALREPDLLEPAPIYGAAPG
jgi:hypothetical protein